MSFSLRTVIRAANASGNSLGPCFSPRTTLGRSLYQFHQLVPVRQFNIRRVITKKKSSEATTTQNASNTVVSKTFVEKQAIAPADNLLEGQLSAPLRTIQHTNGSGTRLEHVNIRNWRSNLILPPNTYFDKWSSALRELDAGGLQTAEAFVGRWSDGLPKTSFRGGRRLIECTSEFSMPLLGLRKVVSYGRDRAEAFASQKVALVSKLYQDGELDSVYQGTIASRKFMAIYEQAAKYGFHPRFKISMSNDQPDAQFQVTLAAPEWNIRAISSAPTYIEALSAVVESYETQTKKRGVKTRLTPEASKDRLDILSYSTAGRALRFLLQKLHIDHRQSMSQFDDAAGPQWIYRIFIKGVHPAEVATIRKADSRYIGITTTVVRLLQHFGYDRMDGFREYLEAAKNDAIKSASSREAGVEKAG